MATAVPIDEHITCSVCLETYKDPHALRCLHTYCLECIKQLQRGTTVACPDCREVTKIEEIKKEFKVQSLIDFHMRTLTSELGTQHQHVCDMCSFDKPLQSKCIDCDQFMCKECENTHKRIRTCKTHKVISVAEIMKSFQVQVEEKQGSIREYKKNIDAKITEIEKSIQGIESSQIQHLREAQHFKQKMIQAIEQHFDSVEETIRTTNHKLVQSLKNGKELCEQMKKEAQSTSDFLAEVANSDDVTALTDTLQSLDTEIKTQTAEIKSKLSKINASANSKVVHKTETFKPEKYFSVGVTKLENLDFSMLKGRMMITNQTTKTGFCHAEKIKIINGYIWCALYNDGLKVYSKNLDLVKEIRHAQLKSCCGIAEVNNGDLVVACRDNNGLHLISNEGSYIECIKKGSFSDVCSYHDKIYALDSTNSEIHILRYSKMKWTCFKTLELQIGRSSLGACGDKICINMTGIYVTSQINKCLYVHDLEGKLLYKTGEKGTGQAGKFSAPMLCDVDDSGNAIVCDRNNNCLQIYNKDERCWSLVAFQEPPIQPFGVVVDCKEESLWTITQERKIVKYRIQS